MPCIPGRIRSALAGAAKIRIIRSRGETARGRWLHFPEVLKFLLTKHEGSLLNDSDCSRSARSEEMEECWQVEEPPMREEDEVDPAGAESCACSHRPALKRWWLEG